MDESERAIVAVLYREFARVQAKSVATDDWFFRFLSIAVVPFLVFVAYALGSPEYRIFIAALPFLSMIGVAVVMVLATHYIYATTYAGYLERRINVYLAGVELRDSRMNKRAYRTWSSPVTLSYLVGFLALIAFNLAAAPAIDRAFVDFLATHPHLPASYETALLFYWPVVYIATYMFTVAAIATLVRTHALCRKCATSGTVIWERE